MNSLSSLSGNRLRVGICFDPRDRKADSAFDVRTHPLYYVELLSGAVFSENTLVYAYQISPTDLRTYYQSQQTEADVAHLTKMTEVIKQQQNFLSLGRTTLGRAYQEQARRHPHAKRIIRELPPLFTTILFTSTDTFSHQQELGFAEYAPAKTKIVRGQQLTTPPKLTGVFLGISNILFLQEKIPDEETLNRLTGTPPQPQLTLI